MSYPLNSTAYAKYSTKSTSLRTLPAYFPTCLVFLSPPLYHTSHPCCPCQDSLPAQASCLRLFQDSSPRSQLTILWPASSLHTKFKSQSYSFSSAYQCLCSQLSIMCQMNGGDEYLFPFPPREHSLLCVSSAKQFLASHHWRERQMFPSLWQFIHFLIMQAPPIVPHTLNLIEEG